MKKKKINQNKICFILELQSIGITDIAWSADNNFLATLSSSTQNTLYIWEIPTLELRAVLNQ